MKPPVTTSLATPQAIGPAAFAIANGADSIRRTVLEIIQCETMSSIAPEQLPGSFGRIPMEISFRFLPVEFDGTSILMESDRCESEVALTRDVSSEGVAFEHPAPLDGRYALAFFPALESQELALLFERLWSKELGPMEFVSGGRFIGVVSAKGLSGPAPRT